VFRHIVMLPFAVTLLRFEAYHMIFKVL
jgi:hypothetical protein